MHSHWQLEVERGFAKAICGTGEGKDARFVAPQDIKMSLTDRCRYTHDVSLTMMLRQNKGNHLKGGKCWLRPHAFSVKKDVSVTSHTDATWRNGRWKAHFLCGLFKFLCVCSYWWYTQFSLTSLSQTEKSLKADKQIMYTFHSLSLPPQNNVQITITSLILCTVLYEKATMKQSKWGDVLEAEQM